MEETTTHTLAVTEEQFNTFMRGLQITMLHGHHADAAEARTLLAKLLSRELDV